MRVALIIERFEAGGGGLEQAAWHTAHALAEAGDAVTVVARRCEPSPSVETVRLQVPESWQPLRVRRFAQRASVWLDRARRDRRIDLAHAWSRVPGADLFHTGEGSHRHYMERTYSAGGRRLRQVSPRHTAQLGLERRIFNTPGLHLQHVSARVGRELSERFGLPEDRQHLIPYGVDLERFARERDPATRALRREIDPGAAEDAPLFLLAGSGWQRKGLDTALRAVAAMTHRDARLWVAGNDRTRPWQRRAEQLDIAGRVRFLGGRPDLERIYPACDALVLPTRYDAFGMVCLEAAAAGRPPPRSGAPRAPHPLADAAVIVPSPDDHRGFAHALDRLCDPAAREALGARGREIAHVHTWRRQTAALRELYAQLANGASGA